MKESIAAWISMIFRVETLMGAIGAFLVIVLTPIGRHIVDKRLSRKPAFLVRSPVLRRDLFLTVEPLNSVARKRKPVGISFNGFVIPQIATPTFINRKIFWQINLAKARDISSLLKAGVITIQLFHDIDQMSAPISLQYAPDEDARSNEASSQPNETATESVEELLLDLRSNSKIDIKFKKGNVTKAHPLETPNIKWINEFDGFELQIIGVTNLNIVGNQCEILADPRYANVLTFRDCHGLRIEGLTLGHEVRGYCLGGVLRFINCSDIRISDCDLFGCGTHGLDFLNCTQVAVGRSIIRDCTYGILQLGNVKDFEFVACKFLRNREFDLIPIQGFADGVFFRDCEFSSNVSKGNLIDFTGDSRASRITFADCEIVNNTFVSLSNRMDLVSIDRSLSTSNSLGGDHYLRSRRGRSGV